MGTLRKRVWLDELGFSDNGHHQFRGAYGKQQVLVNIDPSAKAKLGPDVERALNGLKSRIEELATQRMQNGDSFPVYPYGQSAPLIMQMSFTDIDLDL